MPDNNNNGVSLTDIAIGMAVVDAIGNGGEVVGRKSAFFDNTVDAWGMPRNKFNWLQVLQPQQPTSTNPFIGMDLRNFLGPQATVGFASPGTDFSNDSLGMFGPLGIFIAGLEQYIKGAATELGEKEGRELRAQRERNQPQTPTAGNATAATAQPAVAADDDTPGTTVPAPNKPAVTTASSTSTATRPRAAATDKPVVSTAAVVPVRVGPGEERPDDALRCFVTPPQKESGGETCFVPNSGAKKPPKMGM
jgi:hypothetical protein